MKLKYKLILTFGYILVALIVIVPLIFIIYANTTYNGVAYKDIPTWALWFMLGGQ